MKRSSSHMADNIEKTESRYYEEDVIDLREYLEIISKWRWVIALLTICAVVTSGIISYFILEPVYETKTVLMASQASTSLDRYRVQENTDLESVVNTMSSIPQMTINTYVSQVTNSTVLAHTSEALKKKGHNFTPGDLAEMVKANHLKDTNLVEITVSHTDPVLAAEVANTLREEYLSFISNNNQSKMRKSVEFLDQQIAVEEKNLEELTFELQRMEADLRNPEFLQRELESKYAELSKYQALVNESTYQYQQLLAGRDRLKEQMLEISPTLSTGTLPSGNTLPAGSGGQAVEARTEINPSYVSISDSLIQKETELAEKAAQIKAAQDIINELRIEIRSLQNELAEKKMAMDTLEDKLGQSQKTYDLLNEKRAQTQIMQAANLGETYLLPVSAAPVPTSPVKPNKKLNMAIAGILGLMVSVMLAFLFEFLDNTIKDAEDVRKLFDLPVLGNIPLADDQDLQPRVKYGYAKREEGMAWNKASM